MIAWNLIVTALIALGIASTPLTWFGLRRWQRMRGRLVAVVILPGDTDPTLLEFHGAAAAAIRSMLHPDDLLFILAIGGWIAQGLTLTADERDRAETIINQAAAAWLETDDGQRWLRQYLF